MRCLHPSLTFTLLGSKASSLGTSGAAAALAASFLGSGFLSGISLGALQRFKAEFSGPAKRWSGGLRGRGCSFPYKPSPVLTPQGQASCWSNCYLL